MNNQHATERTKVVSLFALQAENVHQTYIKSGKVDHAIIARLISSLLRMISHFKLTHDDKDRLVMKLASCGDDQAITNIEDGKLYLNGYYSIQKLQEKVLW